VTRGPDRVAPLVQRVEDADEVVAVPGEVVGAGDLERQPVADARLGGSLAGRRDRIRVVVEPGEGRRGVRLREQDEGGALPAADVGDLGARDELVVDTVEGRDPPLDQVAAVHGREEPLGTAVEVVVVLVPAHAAITGERPHDRVDVAVVRARSDRAADEVGRARRIGQAGRLFRGQPVAPGRRVVFAVTAGDLGAEPLLHETRLAAGRGREVRSGARAVLVERPVQAEAITDDDRRRVHRGCLVGGVAFDERLQSIGVGRCLDGHGLRCRGGHGRASSVRVLSVHRVLTPRCSG
jgi:hypothetical protein